MQSDNERVPLLELPVGKDVGRRHNSNLIRGETMEEAKKEKKRESERMRQKEIRSKSCSSKEERRAEGTG